MKKEDVIALIDKTDKNKMREKIIDMFWKSFFYPDNGVYCKPCKRIPLFRLNKLVTVLINGERIFNYE